MLSKGFTSIKNLSFLGSLLLVQACTPGIITHSLTLANSTKPATSKTNSPALIFNSQPPTNWVIGIPMSQEFKVSTIGADGLALTNQNSAITLELYSDSLCSHLVTVGADGGAAISGTAILATNNGTADFTHSGLSIRVAGTDYYLKASSSGFSSACSNRLNVDKGAATKLIFNSVFPDGVAGTLLPSFTVTIEDAFGDIITNANNPVTIAVATGFNPGNATLAGSLVVNSVDGFSTFNNLSLNNAGVGYELKATSGNLTPAVSNSFTISGSSNLTWSPIANDFGSVAIAGTSTGKTFTFTNDGSASATGCTAPTLTGANTNQFSVTSDLCATNNLAPGQSCTVVLKAIPTSAGVKTATITRTCSVGGTMATTANAIQTNGQDPLTNPYYFRDPFPSQLGIITASQDSSSVLYDESGITSKTHLSSAKTVTLPNPYPLTGFIGISTEFWLKITPTSAAECGGFYIAQGPGFQIAYNMGYSNYQLSLSAQGSANGQPGTAIGPYYAVSVQLPADLTAHHYVVTYDTHNFRVFQDGEPMPVKRALGSSPKLFTQTVDDHIGPDGTNQLKVMNYGGLGCTNSILSSNLIGIYGIRISATALTSPQVRSNYENSNLYGQIIYASATGSGVATGASNSTPTTLAHAISLLTPGTKLILASGNYHSSDFQISGLTATATAPILITGEDGISQINVSNDGSAATATVLNSAYVKLRHLNFTDSGSVTALKVSGSNSINLDGLRISGLSDGLQIQTGSAVVVDNSIFTAAARQVYVVNSPTSLFRQNTFYQGQTGIVYDNQTTSTSLLNNIFSQQTVANVSYLNPNPLTIRSDGNDYAPANGASAVVFPTQSFTASDVSSHLFSASVSVSANQSPTTFSLINSSAGVTAGLYGLNNGCVGCGNGINAISSYLAEKKSTTLIPAFTNVAAGDFKLTATSGNPAGTGVPYLVQGGTWTSLYDIQGTLRSADETQDQGNLFDPGAFVAPALLYEKTYTLSSNRTTSAGVYDSTGKLIRTLWSAKSDLAGTNRLNWNGIDDEGRVTSPTGTYSFTVMDYQVTYTPEGLIGNTSANPHDPVHTFHTAAGLVSMAAAGNQLFWVGQYAEGGANIASMDLTNFDVASDYFGNKGNPASGGGPPVALTTQLASDDTTLYGINSHWLLAYSVSTHAPLWQIPSDWTLAWGSTTPFTAIQVPEAVLPSVGYDPRSSANPGDDPNVLTGLAVQPSGNLLFTSRTLDNLVYIFNKTTGASVGTLSVTAPKFLTCDHNGDLWISNTVTGTPQLLHYSNMNSTPTLVSTTTGFSSISALAGSPTDSSALVLDGGTHNLVKKIASDGTVSFTFGQNGGYATNGPLVTHDKFKFDNGERGMGFIAYQPDGSFWIPDSATHRYLHYTMSGNTPTYSNEFDIFPMLYNVTINASDPTKVYGDYIEYAIDYSKTLTQGWTVKYYWGGALSDTAQALVSTGSGLRSVATYSNGKTYAVMTCLNNECSPSNSGSVLYELNTTSGMATTGSVLVNNIFGQWTTDPSQIFQSDLSMLATANVGNGFQIKSSALNGFTNAGAPTYGAAQTLLTMTPSTDPIFKDTLGANNYQWAIGRNNLIVAEMTTNSPGFHMKARRTSDNDWLWQTNSDWGGEDGHGHAESGCQYCMSNIFSNNGNIITYDRGEFYLGGTEANYIHHFYDNGLFIGQFGFADLGGGSIYVANTGKPKAFQSIGNLITGGLVTGTDGNTYLYTNGESASGIGRWKIAVDHLTLQNIAAK